MQDEQVDHGAHAGDDADMQRGANYPAYDYYELYAFDVDCVPRGRLIDQIRFAEVKQNGGLRTHAAICYYTKQGKPLHHNNIAVRKDSGVCLLKPDMTTLISAHRAANGQPRVAQIICDPTIRCPRRNQEDLTSPRAVARSQVKKLQVEGYTIHYCFEMRFILSKALESSPVDSESSWGDMVKLMKYEAMMVEFMDSLREMKVFCASLHRTAGPSHFEFGLAFDTDLKGADMAARFRKEATLFFENKGFSASFRSRGDSESDERFTLPMHMNHYLQRRTGETNVFNDGLFGISNIACNWLAGICLHLPALMAFYRPTETCYSHNSCCLEERTQLPPLYGKHDRRSHFRRKQDGKQTFLENRLPCSTSNPYLVLAGTIAAGLHGIKKKTKLDLTTSPEMPKSLLEALNILDRDEYLKKQLGEDFVDLFIAKKKEELSNCPGIPFYKKMCFIQ